MKCATRVQGEIFSLVCMYGISVSAVTNTFSAFQDFASAFHFGPCPSQTCVFATRHKKLECVYSCSCVCYMCLVDARAHLIWFVDSEKLARDDDVSKCHSPLARDVTLRASHASQLRALHTAHSCADVIAPPVLFLAVIYGLLRRSLVYLRFISSQLPSLVSESLTV